MRLLLLILFLSSCKTQNTSDIKDVPVSAFESKEAKLFLFPTFDRSNARKWSFNYGLFKSTGYNVSPIESRNIELLSSTKIIASQWTYRFGTTKKFEAISSNDSLSNRNVDCLLSTSNLSPRCILKRFGEHKFRAMLTDQDGKVYADEVSIHIIDGHKFNLDTKALINSLILTPYYENGLRKGYKIIDSLTPSGELFITLGLKIGDIITWVYKGYSGAGGGFPSSYPKSDRFIIGFFEQFYKAVSKTKNERAFQFHIIRNKKNIVIAGSVVGTD